jgi:hypothetical protein
MSGLNTLIVGALTGVIVGVGGFYGICKGGDALCNYLNAKNRAKYEQTINSGKRWQFDGFKVTIDGKTHECIRYEVVDELEASGSMILGIGEFNARGNFHPDIRIKLFKNKNPYRPEVIYDTYCKTYEIQPTTILSRHPQWWVE